MFIQSLKICINNEQLHFNTKSWSVIDYNNYYSHALGETRFFALISLQIQVRMRKS